ncbi:transcription antitermination factor NusB [Bombiscardovia coagulans]|uniref:Transcription antitermination protein NusB n=1 Tax=Bombiscardovia coagulans TaxID=686666 RepID=A0A261ETC9_9BIFI|nr:transcription antitermination factor NusB [Bombiscardovia coagulans]OZG50132.1 transcription antitermination factor NusB [Bombiscardovia coagulans]
MARSTARKRALNTLYEADEKEQDIPSLLQERIIHPGAQTPLPQYAIEIVQGVADHLAEINQTVDDHSTSWPLSRMAVIDRNILRIATWEIMYNPEVPNKVAIDEALSLAKTLSEADSPAFIHGLLSSIVRDYEATLVTEAEKEARVQEAARISAMAETEAAKVESEANASLNDQGNSLDDMTITVPQSVQDFFDPDSGEVDQ